MKTPVDHSGWRPVYVLECSQVATQKEFWQLYLARVPTVNAEFFGRNLDAFRDAIAGGPGRPGRPCFIEVLNTEKLQAKSPAFLEALREIGRDAKSEGSEVTISFFQPGQMENGFVGLYQHESFISEELKGAVIHAAEAFESPGGACWRLCIGLEGEVWHAFYISAGTTFWDSLDEPRQADSREDVGDGDVVRNIAEEHALVGEVVTGVEARGSEGEQWLEVRLGSGRRIRLEAIDPMDLDTETLLRVLPA
ncbi:MAG: barstar family protein [Deltaproteobacteria bacterium]|nr:barstar family protein [Deltaproteobacteria bacterium]